MPELEAKQRLASWHGLACAGVTGRKQGKRERRKSTPTRHGSMGAWELLPKADPCSRAKSQRAGRFTPLSELNPDDLGQSADSDLSLPSRSPIRPPMLNSCALTTTTARRPATNLSVCHDANPVLLDSPECQASTEYCGRNGFPVPTRRPRSPSSGAPSSSTRWGVEMSVGGAVGVVGAWWCCVLARGLGARLGGRRPGAKAAEATTRRGCLFLPANSADEIIEVAPKPTCQSSLGVLLERNAARSDEYSLFSFHYPPESCRRMRPDCPRSRTPVTP